MLYAMIIAAFIFIFSVDVKVSGFVGDILDADLLLPSLVILAVITLI